MKCLKKYKIVKKYNISGWWKDMFSDNSNTPWNLWKIGYGCIRTAPHCCQWSWNSLWVKLMPNLFCLFGLNIVMAMMMMLITSFILLSTTNSKIYSRYVILKTYWRFRGEHVVDAPFNIQITAQYVLKMKLKVKEKTQKNKQYGWQKGKEGTA